MANQYHNLGGWLRDVRNVLGDEGYPLADSYYWDLRATLQELLGALDDVTEDLEPPHGDDELEVLGPGDSSDAGPERARPRERSSHRVRGTGGMGRGLPREGDPGPERLRSRLAGLAAPGEGLKPKRQATIEVPAVLNPPRPPSVPRGTKKGVSRRATTPTKRKAR